MTRPSRTFMISLAACAIPGAVIAVIATLGAALGWGGLSFSNPTYYLTIAAAAWCPASKLLMWRLGRREASTCPTCVPGNAIARRFSSGVNGERQ